MGAGASLGEGASVSSDADDSGDEAERKELLSWLSRADDSTQVFVVRSPHLTYSAKLARSPHSDLTADSDAVDGTGTSKSTLLLKLGQQCWFNLELISCGFIYFLHL